MHPENNIGDVMKAKIDSKNSVRILIVKALFNENTIPPYSLKIN